MNASSNAAPVRWHRVLWVASALCLAACGTTVSDVTAGGVQGPTADGLGAPLTGEADASVADGAPHGVDAPALGPGSATDVAPGRDGSAASTPSSDEAVEDGTSAVVDKPATAGAAKGRGFDDKSVYIGVTTQKDASSALSALGVAGLDFGDQEGQTRAAVAEVNRTGGMLGRKLVPRFQDVKSADALANPQVAAEAACRGLTEDTQVIAVVNLVAAIDLPSFNACMAKAGTPVISGGLLPVSTASLRKFHPYLYSVAAPAFDQMSPLLVARLQAQKYFAGWDTNNGAPGSAEVKVGLIYKGSPDQEPLARNLIALLEKQGVEVASEYAYDGSSTERATRDHANAVLPFRAAGVTHVLHLSSEVFYFMNAAENQGYRPRYGLTSLSATNLLLQGAAPPRQLNGSMGIGWLPAADVDPQGRPSPAGAAACAKVMEAGGQNVAGGAALTSAEFCDAVFLVAESARAGGAFSAEALRQGTVRLGTSFPAATTFRSGLSSTRATVPVAARDLIWDAGSRSFRYVDSTTRGW